jgi:hypothetical protein
VVCLAVTDLGIFVSEKIIIAAFMRDSDIRSLGI